MRPYLAVTLTLGMTLAGGPPARAAQKIDSLLVRLAVPKERALDMVVTAFTHAGLTVTNTSPALVEADQGQTGNREIGGVEFHRVVRAVLMGADSTTTVLITGEERRTNRYGTQFKRLRIDNRAGGNGGTVWRKMVAAALAMDSTAVLPEAVDSP